MRELSRSFFFFFSSRRRHTRLVSDWSSDVCSSDLSADDVVSGRELWKSDGTVGGAVQVKDIAPGVGSVGGALAPISSSPAGFTVFNNALYFSADDGVNGRELGKTDGTKGTPGKENNSDPPAGA